MMMRNLMERIGDFEVICVATWWRSSVSDSELILPIGAKTRYLKVLVILSFTSVSDAADKKKKAMSNRYVEAPAVYSFLFLCRQGLLLQIYSCPNSSRCLVGANPGIEPEIAACEAVALFAPNPLVKFFKIQIPRIESATNRFAIYTLIKYLANN